MLYKVIVRAHLEYCNAVTHSIYDGQVKILEGVQRRATKLVLRFYDMAYTDRLKVINLPSVRYRRARGAIIEAHK